MHIIYLPGNTPDNKNWIETVKSKFDSFSTGDILYYHHWQTGSDWIDLSYESKMLADLVKGKKNYCVFAKSVGTLLAIKNISDKTLLPQKAIFCGLPYRLAKRENLPIGDLLKSLSIPIIFIQNESDPVCGSSDLQKILKANPPADFQLVSNPADNSHDYVDYDKLTKTAKDFFESK